MPSLWKGHSYKGTSTSRFQAGQYHAEPGGVNELSGTGGKRISVGSAFAQLACGSLVGVAQEIAQQGSFQFIKKAIDYKELETFFA